MSIAPLPELVFLQFQHFVLFPDTRVWYSYSVAVSGERKMQERSDQTNIEPPPSEAITADWQAVSADVFQIAPTVTRDIHSTSGPNNALRQTVADESRKDESQYPDLIGLRRSVVWPFGKPSNIAIVLRWPGLPAFVGPRE